MISRFQFAAKIQKAHSARFTPLWSLGALCAFTLFLLPISPVAASGTKNLSGQAAAQQPPAKDSQDPCCTAIIPSKPIATPLPRTDAKSLVPWSYDIEGASAAALRSNKPLMIEFWAGWCAVCKVFDKEVFSDPQIAAAIRGKFVPIKVNFDSSIELDKAYGIKSLPTVVFADSYGSELLRTFGAVTHAKFAGIVADFPADIARINSFDRALAANRNDLSSLYGFAREASGSRLYELSNTTYQHVLTLETDPEKKELALAAEGFNYIELKNPRMAIQIFEKCLHDSASTPNKSLFMVGLGQAYAAAGERDGARKLLASVIDQYPHTANAAKAEETLRKLH